jgi:CTP synthase (UTP-ammonia lyase)
VTTVRIGLIGDYNPHVKAHIAIPKALAFASEAIGRSVAGEWIGTETLEQGVDERLSSYDGLWCVPASPYVSMDGALNAIRYARENMRPFLGTCGGFQHALIEYARNVIGIADADHAESNPDASVLFVTPLTCALRGVKGKIILLEGSRAREIYGLGEGVEEYNCGFGLNPQYRALLEESDLSITGLDDEGEVRVVELAGHPFFMATLYQPERQALTGVAHPLINAFAQAAAGVKDAPAPHASLVPS